MQSLGDIMRDMVRGIGPALPDVPEEPVCGICNGFGWISRRVPVGHPSFGQVYQCDCQLTALVESLEGFEVDDKWPDLATALQATRDWLADKGPAMLIFTGPRGVGKSHLLLAAKNDLLRRRLSVLSYTDRQLDSAMRASFDEGDTRDFLDRLAREPFFLLDDYGLISRQGQLEGLMDDLISARWVGAREGRRSLITTNVKATDMTPRILSRFNDQTRSLYMAIDASDYRLKKREEC